MPSLNMMKDMDVSDPWARDLEKTLGKPVERAIPMPDCLKRLEEKRKAEERFEKMVDTVLPKPAAKPTLPVAAPAKPKESSYEEYRRREIEKRWNGEAQQVRTTRGLKLDSRLYASYLNGLRDYKPADAEDRADSVYANQFMNLWNDADGRRKEQEKQDRAHWVSQMEVRQSRLAVKPDLIIFDDLEGFPATPEEFAEQEIERNKLLRALDL